MLSEDVKLTIRQACSRLLDEKGYISRYCQRGMIAEIGNKLVISTATVNLQEQIVYTDLPDIRGHAGLHFSSEFT